ncbi:hypothetical protein TPHA_0C02440 [Tetrapisispora phaffii CBS 4417]|uniref:Succinate dehydrogenase [ubiquinone] cytochrome b small subunit n=1 Tax=Tetrapisispora phaffii (strain ATCC 24235 / CBS 4417 / NBRC 1672 / NRRL Y-8282 / UCD 70-5) TaxID=1071381 RepID=G8BRM1_TETPH|nr:hypothetical protein TPHA_0C02440 [Tetrapisispora phaffii CBS 4417]CCE62397.1 hypothetical protein TPHA_0C02440 [Tetrapisispora phaffii CBS 4417]
MLRNSINFASKRSFHACKPACFRIPFLPTLPQQPGGVKGNVNEAYVPPKIDKVHGSYHWGFEKIISMSVLPLVTLPLISGGAPLSVTTDVLLASAGMFAFMVEFQSCITDYVQKRVYGNINKYAMYLLYGGSVLSILGIYNLQKPDEEKKENTGFIGLLNKFFKIEQK